MGLRAKVEWSTSVLLSPEQSGWDRFALQLDDGRDPMLDQLRFEAGGGASTNDLGSHDAARPRSPVPGR